MMSRSSSLTSVSELFRPSKGLRNRDLSSTRLSALKKEIKTDTHIIPISDLAVQLETDLVNGLTSAKAAQLLAYYGPNALTPSSSYTWQKTLFKAMCTGFSVLVWAGAALCLMAYVIEAFTKVDSTKDNLYLGCILIVVDITCGLFSFTQNYKSVKIMKTFTDMIPQYATCIRDGEINNETLVRNIVRGDLVKVGAGDIVPADIRIIQSRGFKVDNSSLTGESIAVSRSNCEGSQNILESLNVAFFSTLCVEGWAIGVVLCCGDATAMGRVAGLAARLQPGPSPLAQQISRFMRAMSIWAIALGVFIGISSFILGYSFVQTIIFVIGIVVANVPEGLQPTVTAALTLTAKKMVTKNCLVKNIEAVEALGACTTICSDKTGTLTVNKMRLENVWVFDKIYDVDIDGGLDSELQKSSVFETLKLCGSLCSSAVIDADGIVKGDASESAILNFLAKYDRPMEHRELHPKMAEIPFNSTNKYQVSVHLDLKSSSHVLMMKGAPECVIVKCGNIATERGNIKLNKDISKVIEKSTEHLAETGKRILGFAYLPLDKSKFPVGFAFDSETINFPMENFTFIGVVGLMDPPRPEVHEAIKRVRLAGVRVLMVTGDHPLTALAIASKVGIATSPQCHVLTGSELREMTNDLLDKIITKHPEIVFARTSPTQKLQIVESCQRLGSVVAVTGDGVNDAPALKQADIGISMGITGSQVSKQTADIILIDDNFATIVTGIEEGRKIYDNLKKSVCYILISNVPEIMPVLFFILFSIPLPLGAMTILCIDLGTDMWPAVALSHEKAESDVMARPPRSNESLVSTKMLFLAYGHNGLIETAAGMYCYFIIMAQFGFFPNILFGIRQNWDNEAISDLKDSYGQEWTYAERKQLERACQASYFMAVVFMQVMNGMVCKTRYNSLFQVGLKNHVLNVGFIFEIALAALICYTPGVNDFFRTYPLKPSWLFLATPFIILLFSFEEFRKYCIRKELFGRWFNKTTFY